MWLHTHTHTHTYTHTHIHTHTHIWYLTFTLTSVCKNKSSQFQGALPPCRVRTGFIAWHLWNPLKGNTDGTELFLVPPLWGSCLLQGPQFKPILCNIPANAGLDK